MRVHFHFTMWMDDLSLSSCATELLGSLRPIFEISMISKTVSRSAPCATFLVASWIADASQLFAI